jgi:class 3 adenylate cyclase
VREFDEAGQAFNQMMAGLRWFETYVPRRLVQRLMARRASADLVSEEREVTVMFTDLRGFTQTSEHLSAASVAAMINEHFAMLYRCIDAEDGTVDKYIGDGMMVFWGAPIEQPDHAARAWRAIRAMAAAVVGDNRRRRADGLMPFRLAIGAHAGPVVVGNIGPPGRVNYTVVGDAVNMASRLLDLAKEQPTDDDVVVLLSGTAAVKAGLASDQTRDLGWQTLRGRSGSIEVRRVVGLSPG